MPDKKRLLVGDKEITLDTLSQIIASGMLNAVKNTGRWEKFNLSLQFHAKRDGQEVSFTDVVLSPAEDKLQTKSEKKSKEQPEKFLEDLKKI